MNAKVINHLLTHDPAAFAMNLYSGHGYIVRYGKKDDETIVIDFSAMYSKWDEIISEKSSEDLKKWASQFTKALNLIYFASDAKTMLMWHDNIEEYIEATYSILSHYKLERNDVLFLLQSVVAKDFREKWGEELATYL